MSVDEFRSFLTFNYGPTDQTDYTQIKGVRGILTISNLHIELWDGEYCLQSAEGLKKHGRKPGAVMSPSFLLTKPLWFWQVGEAQAPAAVPDWLQGWWTAYDGNYYYYYFFSDGAVCYIETKPNPKWTPPKQVGNHGRVKSIANGFTILWNPTGPGETPTREDFTRLDWTSTTEMNGVSLTPDGRPKYSPLFARKM